MSGSWWFPLPPSSVGNVDVERLEYDSGPALWKMFLPVTGSLQWNYYFCWVRNVAISLGPMCVWSGLYLTEPALGIWRLPWGQQVFPGLDLKKKKKKKYIYIYIYKQSQVSMQLSFVDLQGLVEAAAMETVQLSSHSNLPPRSVGSRISSFPLIESVYHLFNFFLSMGQGAGSASLWSVVWGWSQSCTSLCWKMLYFASQTSVSH